MRYKLHTIEFEVRDSEIDLQGIVHNYIYHTYTDHARVQFLRSIGFDYFEMAKNGQNIYLINTSIDFKKALKPQDKFYIETTIEKEGVIKFAFIQILKLCDSNEVIAQAKNTCVCIDENNRKRPYLFDAIEKELNK